METISQMASTAAKYAFGDSSNQEPISGTQGDVAKGEPYDAGNLEANDQERLRQSDVRSIPGAYTTSGDDFDGVSKGQNTGNITTATNATADDGFTRPQHDMSAPGLGARDDNVGGITTSTNRTTDSGFTSPGGDMGGSGRGTSGLDNTRSSGLEDTRSSGLDNTRSSGLDNTRSSGLDNTRNSGLDDTRSSGLDNTRSSGLDNTRSSGLDNTRSSGLDNTRSYGLDNTRSTSGLDSNNDRNTSNQNLNATGDNLTNPDVHRADDAASRNIDSKSKPSEKPSAEDEPSVDVSGPGPRDLSSVAREHGGDAGSHGSGSASSGTKATDSKDNSNDSGLPADQSEEQGTGEQYVKSSGLQADGGDFDATKPGAGREADRLMEQKGIAPTASSKGKESSTSSSGDHKTHGSGSGEGKEKEKHGLVEKIKEKLHKH
ncbi:hypothetical protein LEL_09182 [Akanthomyces lecanii RCEF 1005]|uniref:Glycine-rich cell wall structural protein 1 n=1 Tax=Akanthomyces lecanii RCEF 1005 TaxID=1081108 RepID=A0A168CYI1_CORDF|nr:hypothetical protein LEL_09182 [Akanthomyces lecanii RCEF 1005]